MATIEPIAPNPPQSAASTSVNGQATPGGVKAAPPTDEQRRVVLCQLRAVIQDLQGTLDTVAKGNMSLKDFAPYITTVKNQTGALIDQITPIDGVADGDFAYHIQNIWEEIQVNPVLVDPTADSITAQNLLNYLNLLQSQCHDMVLDIGYLTIPAELNDDLAKSRPGYYVPFHTVFASELPAQEDRVKVLTWLAYSPLQIKGGLVDIETGLIYRYSTSTPWQIFTAALALGVLALCTILVLISAYLPIHGWPLTQSQSMTALAGWAAILAGIVVHLGVDTAKQMKDRASLPPVLALGDALPIVNARIGQILLKLLTALVGFFFLVFAVGIKNGPPLDYFLGGYTLDSLLALFGATADQRAGSQITAIKQRLGIQDGS